MSEANQFTPRNRQAIYLMLIGAFTGAINQTILSPALPSIMRDLHIDAVAGQWLTTTFLLITGIMIPCTAYLMARFSKRQLYLSSMLVFGTGTLFCGLSHTFLTLLLSRILQALGFGLLMPLLMATILMVYPPERHGKAMAMIGMVFTIAPAIGPSIAGFLVDSYRWNVVFLALTPLIFLDIILSFLIMPKDEANTRIPLDKTSVVMSTIGFGGLLYSFSSVGNQGWLSPHFIISFIVGSVTVYFFVKRQKRLQTPLLRFDALQNKRFAVGNLISMVLNATLIFGAILTPIYLQEIHGYSAFVAALIMLPSAIISAIMNVVVGDIYDKHGGRLPILIGLLIMSLGSACYAFFQEDSSLVFLVLAYSIRIMGIGMVVMPITTWAMGEMRGDDIPHANALINTMRQISGSIGTAIFVSVYSIVQMLYSHSNINGSLMGIRASFGLSVVVSVIALIIAYRHVHDVPVLENTSEKTKAAHAHSH